MKRSDEDAYRVYVATHVERWRRTAYLLCRDWDLADDLVAVVLVRLYRRWRHIDLTGNVDGYARTVLTRAWLDELRRPWRREKVTADVHVPATVADASGTIAERAGLVELLARLGARQRAVIVLRFYCDLSIEETAQILKVTAGTIKSQTARGLETLRGAANDTEVKT